MADPYFSLAALTAPAQGGLGEGVRACGIPNLGTSLRLPGLSAGWEGASSWTGWGETPWDHPAACQFTGPGRGWAGAGGCAQAACQDAPIWGAPCIPGWPLCSLGCCLGFVGLLDLSRLREVPQQLGKELGSRAKTAGKGPCASCLVGCWERNPCGLPTPWSWARSPPTSHPTGLFSPAVESITSDPGTWLGAKARGNGAKLRHKGRKRS